MSKSTGLTERDLKRIVNRCITDSELAPDIEHAQVHLIALARNLADVQLSLERAAETLHALAARILTEHGPADRDTP